MLLFKKKIKDIDEDDYVDPSTSVPKAAQKKKSTAVLTGDYHEFIPYHSHYNAHTLVTKNGELMQILKIDTNKRGQNYENIDSSHASVREAIREALSATLTNEDFSFWIHTLRKRRPVAYNMQHGDGLPGYISDNYERAHRWEFAYYNEIYISILHNGQAAPLLDKDHLRTTLFQKTNRKFRGQYLDASYAKLDPLVTALGTHIANHYHVQRLGLVERPLPAGGKASRQPIFFSEPMEFLGSLLNLRPEQFPLPDVDLSVGLQTSRLSFGFNAIEARTDIGQKRYGALLSLKQFREMPTSTVDQVLQAPIELLISQSFKFMPASAALKTYRTQKEFFDISGDKNANEIFGIDDMLASNHKTPTDFSECQTSMMVLVDDFDQLDSQMEKFQNMFAKLGLITIREDLRMEESFWSQLPGNFDFIRRKDAVATEKAGGFCRLNRYPLGNAGHNHWGACLSLIPTLVDSPYFFNFHVGDNGHTALYDFNSFGDKAAKLIEFFLLMQTQKFGARIVCFDRAQSARLLSNKLGGSYYPLDQIARLGRDANVNPNAPKLVLNPFHLEPSRYNLSFLAAWCGLLIAGDAPLGEATRDHLRQAVSALYEQPAEARNLSAFIAALSVIDAELAARFAPWVKGGPQAGLFDAPHDEFSISNIFTAFDMTPAVASPVYLLPLFSYLMHRVIEQVDGKPMVIVLHEAWELLENNFFAPRMESLLEMLRQNNVMVLFTRQHHGDIANTRTLSNVMESCATKIYVPDDVPAPYSAYGLDLSLTDEVLLESMERQKGDFLVKQNDESIGLRLNIQSMEDVVAIFTNDIKGLGAAHGRYASVPKDY